MKIAWQGSGLEEQGIDTVSGRTVVRVDPGYFRPAEVETLLGDSTKARQMLGWKPLHTFGDLVKDMCIHELESQ
jgi:GDPmannose 4,6-dehydratase